MFFLLERCHFYLNGNRSIFSICSTAQVLFGFSNYIVSKFTECLFFVCILDMCTIIVRNLHEFNIYKLFSLTL